MQQKNKDTFSKSLDEIVEKVTFFQNQTLNQASPVRQYGKITSAVGTTLRSTIENVSIGDLCLVTDVQNNISIYAEVIALEHDEVVLLPLGTTGGLSKNALVSKTTEQFTIAVGDHLIGKIIDGLGKEMGSILKKSAPLEVKNKKIEQYSVMKAAPPPLSRPLVTEVFNTGVKCLDMFLTCGKGQRMAIFAAAGMGKTTLMGMITRGAKADVIVVGLIGERGREVNEFIDLELNEDIRRKTVLVVSTSDRPPAEHVKSGFVAHTIAEYFRDQGKSVLLLVDSITRFARAQREVGISAKEPVSRGGFPPSVFLAFPRLMERAGNNEKGSITAFYTVLMEGDTTLEDPIADEVKSIVDGHIVMSKKLVERGHFPAVNIQTSLSRIADRIITEKHLLAARKIRLLLSKYDEIELLLRVGEYQKGSDPLADEAIKKYNQIMDFLKQLSTKITNFNDELRNMIRIAEG